MVSVLSQNKTSKALSKSTYWAFITASLLILTMLVRVLWLRVFSAQPTAPVDAEGYFLLARNILEGHGFAIAWEPPFCPNAVRTPLYPLFLVFSFLLFGPVAQRAVLLHILMEVLTCAISIRLGCDLGKLASVKPSTRYVAGTLAGILYAINGTTQRYTGFLYAETFLLPLLSTAVLLTCRVLRRPSFRSSSAAGLFWALSMLTKPNVQYIAIGTGILLTIFIFRCKFRMKRSLLMISGFWLVMALLLFPWQVRNKLLTSRWLVSSAFEENIARVAAVATQAEIMGVRVEPWSETWEYIYDVMVMQVSMENGWLFSSEPRFNCNTTALQHMQITQAARHFVSRHLSLYFKVHLRGVMRSLLDPGHHLWYSVFTGESWSSTGAVPDIVERISWSLKRKAVGDAVHAFVSQRIIQVPLFAGVIWWGLWAGRLLLWYFISLGFWHLRQHPWHLCILLGTLLYIIILPGPIAHDRFYMPAVPIVIAITALGLRKDGK